MSPILTQPTHPRRKGRPTAEAPVLDIDGIVNAAAKALESGRGDFSMRGLAATLGVDPMALYHHVPSKQALLDAVVAKAFQRLDRLPKRWAHVPDRPKRLYLLSEAYLRCVAPLPQLSRHLARGSASFAHLRFAALFEAAVGVPVKEGSVLAQARDVLVDYLHGAALAGSKVGVQSLQASWPLLVQVLRAGMQRSNARLGDGVGP